MCVIIKDIYYRWWYIYDAHQHSVMRKSRITDSDLDVAGHRTYGICILLGVVVSKVMVSVYRGHNLDVLWSVLARHEASCEQTICMMLSLYVDHVGGLSFDNMIYEWWWIIQIRILGLTRLRAACPGAWLNAHLFIAQSVE